MVISESLIQLAILVQKLHMECLNVLALNPHNDENDYDDTISFLINYEIS